MKYASKRALAAAPAICDPRVEQVQRSLRLQPSLNITELAATVELSPSRLRHLFKSEVGITVGDFAKEAKLLRARELLEMTHHSIKWIRAEVCIRMPPTSSGISRSDSA